MSVNFSVFSSNKAWGKVKVVPGIWGFSLSSFELDVDLFSSLVGEGSLGTVDDNEPFWGHNSSSSVESFSGWDWWSYSDDDVPIVVTSGGGEVDSNGVGSSLLGSTCNGAILVSLEPLGEVDEFEEGIIKSEYSELGGVVFSYEGGGGKRRAKEVLAAASLQC